jgi:DNA-binding CsgD family transcriptional regulator
MQPARHLRGPEPWSGGRGVRVSPVLVGREEMLALADRRLAAMLDGSGHLLFLAGEAGIGKTRLLGEITARARAQGVIVVQAATFPRDAEVAGGLLVDLASELTRSGSPAVAQAGFQMGARLRQRVVAADGAGQEPDPEETGDASRGRRILVADLTDAVLAAAPDGTGGVLLSLEDLHWADDLSLEVLGRLAGRLGGLRLLVVGSYRSDELYPRVPMRTWRTRLLTQRLAEEIRLPRLSTGQSAELADAIAGTTLPRRLTETLFARSDGIPLHIEELLGGSALDEQGPVAPESLAEVVLARAAALSTHTRSVIAAAATIGRSFDVDLLTAVTGEEPAVIDAAIRELTDRYLIAPRPDGASYDFRHALIRDALYADLPPHQRRRLHARVAAVALAAGLGDAFVSDQYERAGQPAQAYHHARVAADEACAVGAHREAAQLYRRAQRTTPTATPDAERADLLAALATTLAAIDDNAAAAAEYAQAYQLRLALRDFQGAAELVPPLVAVRHLTGASLLERSQQLTDALVLLEEQAPQARDTRVRVLAALSAAHMLDRRLAEATRYGEQARALAAATDPATQLNLDATVGAVYVFAGRGDEGWDLLQNAVRRGSEAGLEAETARAYRMAGSSASVLVEYDRAEHSLTAGIEYAERTEHWNDRYYMEAHRAHVRWAVGDWVGAERDARHALADGRYAVTTLITALHVLGYLALGRGDWLAAREQLNEARRLGATMNELQRVSPALWGLAELALHGGQPAEAVRLCEEGFTASAAVGDAAYLFPFLVTGARAYLALDQLEGARHWVARAERPLLMRAIPGTQPAIAHAHGLLELAGGQTGKARDRLEAAGRDWAQRRRFWEGTWALLDAARCALRSRRPGPAAALVTHARTAALAAGASTLVAAAEAIGATAPSSSAGPLSARELEVARLVATGATNREIGAALHIAPKTVAAHVEHILAKLGAARRTEVAAWFATRDAVARGWAEPRETGQASGQERVGR